MARGRGRGGQPQVRGFRPGKEPPELKKRRAKEQFGKVNAAQERLIEVFAERTPEESAALMGRWRKWLLVASLALAALGVALYGWSVVAGVIVQVLGALLLFFWWQLRRQRKDLEAMAEAVSGGGRGRRRK